MSDEERGEHADEESREQGAVTTATEERDRARVEHKIERRDRVVEEAGLGALAEFGPGDRPPDPLRDRLVLPLLLPIGSFLTALSVRLTTGRQCGYLPRNPPQHRAAREGLGGGRPHQHDRVSRLPR
jgi:hypothetical protein